MFDRQHSDSDTNHRSAHRYATVVGLAAALSMALVIMAAPRSAAAETRLQIDAVADHVHTLDSSYQRLHDGPFMNVGGAEVMVGLDDIFPGLRTHLRWTGGYRAAAVYEDDVSLDWSHSLVMAGAGYGYQPWDFAEFYGKLSVGWSRQHLDVRTGQTTFDQNADNIALQPAVGAEFFLPLTPAEEAPDKFTLSNDLTFGFNLEGGYYWQPPAKFDNVTSDASQNDFSGGGLSLGDLKVSGPTLSWGLFVRARFR